MKATLTRIIDIQGGQVKFTDGKIFPAAKLGQGHRAKQVVRYTTERGRLVGIDTATVNRGALIIEGHLWGERGAGIDIEEGYVGDLDDLRLFGLRVVPG